MRNSNKIFKTLGELSFAQLIVQLFVYYAQFKKERIMSNILSFFL